MWQPLAANLTVTMAMLMAWLVLGERVTRLSPARQTLAFAALMAGAALASMALSFQLAPGVFFDFRSPLLALAGLFGGWPAALVVGGVALVYRISMGGALLAGVLSIAASVVAGLAARWVCRSRVVGMVEIACLSGTVALIGLLVPLTLPAAARQTWAGQMWTPVSMSALCTVIVGTLLLFETRRREFATANAQFRAMVEALPDCLNIKDTNGRFVAANEATAKLMRAPSAAALIGKSDFDFYPTEVACAFRADEGRIIAAGVHEMIEQERRFDDGTQGWLSTLKAPLKDEQGRVVALVTHNRDVTEAKKLQVKLAETQAHLDQALANMNDGLVMYDVNGVMLFCNQRFRDLFPLTGPMRVAGSSFEDLMRASVLLGEQALTPGLTLDEHVAAKRARLRTSGEHQLTLSDGRFFVCRTKVLSGGSTLGIMSDVTERVMSERHLQHQALHDALTGLPNRAHFNRSLAQLLDKARSDEGELVVMLLDLDSFKQVNDTFGHPTGDALLVEVSRRLEGTVRQGDLVARLGGDEFAVLVYGMTNGTGDAGLANRIMKSLTKPMQTGDVTLMPGGTIGYAMFPHDGLDAETLIKRADAALYQAKARRRGSWKRWQPAVAVETPASLAQAG